MDEYSKESYEYLNAIAVELMDQVLDGEYSIDEAITKVLRFQKGLNGYQRGYVDAMVRMNVALNHQMQALRTN